MPAHPGRRVGRPAWAADDVWEVPQGPAGSGRSATRFDREDRLEWIGFLAFVLPAMITPGPANISAAGAGVEIGYRRSLPYLFGLVSGFVVVLSASGLLVDRLRTLVPSLERYLGPVAAIYLAYLAFGILREEWRPPTDESQPEPKGAATRGSAFRFPRAIVLQFVNPKLWLFAIAAMGAFVVPAGPVVVVTVALGLGVAAFAIVSLWAMMGVAINRTLHKPGPRRAVNAVLAAALLFAAIQVSGLVGG